MPSQDNLTKTDLIKIEASIKKLLKNTNSRGVDQRYVDVLEELTNTVNKLRIMVEFDHEKRLQAIEEYLQETY